ncbi:hypothetical protein MXM51_22800 [Pantoea stewartii]|uniref:hypothetical protein n=1 Tax=Pantoea stewartii TaxID=66269 RepID=UPI002DBC27B0|nr:hypothetical protein [Pantoea stewartii]MEB6537342.1 hypothetical protein [Pantoea stewartii]
MKTLSPVITAIRNNYEDYLYLVESRLKGSINSKAVMLEMLIHRLFDKYVTGLPEFHRQGWYLMELSNGGFYFYPADERVFTIRIGNFSVSIDNHQLGMALTFDVLTAVFERTRDQAFHDALLALEAFFVEADRKNHADGIRAYLKFIKLV